MEKDRPIMLIEDDRIDIMTVERGFKKLEIENPLVVVHNGDEALDILHNSKSEELPELILLDLNLPKVDGFEFLRKIKSTPRLKRIPVIIVTTSNSTSDKAECYDLGVAGYFVKPLNYFTLLNSIIQYWNLSQSPPIVNNFEFKA